MADHIFHQLSSTIRESPKRAALAAVLLITTTIYVCADHRPYGVAEVGGLSSPEELIDLTDPNGLNALRTVAVTDDDTPATTHFAEGRERYIDVRLTHAVAIEDSDTEPLRHVEQVSEQASESHPSSQVSVWLLGVLADD